MEKLSTEAIEFLKEKKFPIDTLDAKNISYRQVEAPNYDCFGQIIIEGKKYFLVGSGEIDKVMIANLYGDGGISCLCSSTPHTDSDKNFPNVMFIPA